MISASALQRSTLFNGCYKDVLCIQKLCNKMTEIWARISTLSYGQPQFYAWRHKASLVTKSLLRHDNIQKFILRPVYLEFWFHYLNASAVLVAVDARSKAWVYGRSFAGIAGSNPAGGMDVCLLWVLCLVRWRYMRRADHSSRGALMTVVCLSVVVKPREWGGPDPLRAVAPRGGKRSMQSTRDRFVLGLSSDGDSTEVTTKAVLTLHYILHTSLLCTAPCAVLLPYPRRESR